jgi:hypothetical protein
MATSNDISSHHAGNGRGATGSLTVAYLSNHVPSADNADHHTIRIAYDSEVDMRAAEEFCRLNNGCIVPNRSEVLARCGQ